MARLGRELISTLERGAQQEWVVEAEKVVVVLYLLLNVWRLELEWQEPRGTRPRVQGKKRPSGKTSSSWLPLAANPRCTYTILFETFLHRCGTCYSELIDALDSILGIS